MLRQAIKELGKLQFTVFVVFNDHKRSGLLFSHLMWKTVLSECSTFKGTVPWAAWRLFLHLEEASAPSHHPGPSGFVSSFALTAVIALPGEGKPQFMVWLKTQGWTSCLQLVEQRKMMGGQGDKGTVGGAAFGTKTALNGLMLNMKPSPRTCNTLWSFGRPCYVQYWPKLAVGSMGSLNGSNPSSLGYLRWPALMGTKGQHGKSNM